MRIKSAFRFTEIMVMVYRILLVFVAYQLARLLFWWYNKESISVDSVSEYFSLAYHGTAFDMTALLYVNSLFILLSVLPLVINTRPYFQKYLKILYFITNGIAYSLNFGDFIYFKFSKTRLTSAAFDVMKNEDNLFQVFWASFLEHPSVLIFYIIIMVSWYLFYQKVTLTEQKPTKNWSYFLGSFILLCITTTLVIGGIRGDFKHSTRPINMVDANRYTRVPDQGFLVLNSTFSLFRTIDTNGFRQYHFVSPEEIKKLVAPYKKYDRVVADPPNIVIIIVESFGREYSGAFNEGTSISNFKSYTPFVDSLAKKSLIFTQSYANGRQSIHGMSSVLAGIPSLTDAFTSSPYANQKITSVVSIANSLGYQTSFFHGAPNGSMGFLGFGNILGFQKYYGKTEYNNDADYDGIWSIWDEPFLQYFAKNSGKKTPFLATVFTASSHHPFKVPKAYENKFDKGTIEMHQPIQYADFALKKYFETAKKQPWFHNTVFVITGDHTNQVAYPEYEKAMNRFAVPILFYSPNSQYQLVGKSQKIAQQIDIYPTLVDLMGYHQPFRSWGNSLLDKKPPTPIIVNSDGQFSQFIIGEYNYRFDGENCVGVYDKTDLGLEKNKLNKINPKIQEQGIKTMKAWMQDYMDRIINRKL